MIDQKHKKQVENARVRIHYEQERFGCGVLVSGGYILTVAHCVPDTTTVNATMARIEDKQDYLISVETAFGVTFKCETLAVECCADIAVLGRLGSYIPEGNEDRKRFDDFLKQVDPLRLRVPALNDDVFFLTHSDEWIPGTWTGKKTIQNTVGVKSLERIRPGTSGSPIVDCEGNLVSLTSRVLGHPALSSSPYAGEHPQRGREVWSIKTQYLC